MEATVTRIYSQASSCSLALPQTTATSLTSQKPNSEGNDTASLWCMAACWWYAVGTITKIPSTIASRGILETQAGLKFSKWGIGARSLIMPIRIIWTKNSIQSPTSIINDNLRWWRFSHTAWTPSALPEGIIVVGGSTTLSYDSAEILPGEKIFRFCGVWHITRCTRNVPRYLKWTLSQENKFSKITTKNDLVRRPRLRISKLRKQKANKLFLRVAIEISENLF